MTDVTVIVQTCGEREQVREATIASLRQSDARDFTVIHHPVGTRHCRFFLEVLRTMADVDTPWVIRLEDDVLVSKHLIHNFLTWPALRDERFGIGWLYVSEMVRMCHPPDARGHRLRNDPVMPNAFGVGLHRDVARACVAEYERWLSEYGCGLHHCVKRGCTLATKTHPANRYGQDALFSRTVWDLGKRVFLSEPALVEARPEVPTVVGTRYPPDADKRHFRAGPNFDPDWRRAT